MKTVDWEMAQVKALAEQIANIRTSAWIRSTYVKAGWTSAAPACNTAVWKKDTEDSLS